VRDAPTSAGQFLHHLPSLHRRLDRGTRGRFQPHKCIRKSPQSASKGETRHVGERCSGTCGRALPRQCCRLDQLRTDDGWSRTSAVPHEGTSTGRWRGVRRMVLVVAHGFLHWRQRTAFVSVERCLARQRDGACRVDGRVDDSTAGTAIARRVSISLLSHRHDRPPGTDLPLCVRTGVPDRAMWHGWNHTHPSSVQCADETNRCGRACAHRWYRLW
jgi:hypothetical protein